MSDAFSKYFEQLDEWEKDRWKKTRRRAELLAYFVHLRIMRIISGSTSKSLEVNPSDPPA